MVKNNFTPIDSLLKGIHIGVYTLDFHVANKNDIKPSPKQKINRNKFTKTLVKNENIASKSLHDRAEFAGAYKNSF